MSIHVRHKPTDPFLNFGNDQNVLTALYLSKVIINFTFMTSIMTINTKNYMIYINDLCMILHNITSH